MTTLASGPAVCSRGHETPPFPLVDKAARRSFSGGTERKGATYANALGKAEQFILASGGATCSAGSTRRRDNINPEDWQGNRDQLPDWSNAQPARRLIHAQRVNSALGECNAVASRWADDDRSRVIGIGLPISFSRTRAAINQRHNFVTASPHVAAFTGRDLLSPTTPPTKPATFALPCFA